MKQTAVTLSICLESVAQLQSSDQHCIRAFACTVWSSEGSFRPVLHLCVAGKSVFFMLQRTLSVRTGGGREVEDHGI